MDTVCKLSGTGETSPWESGLRVRHRLGPMLMSSHGESWCVLLELNKDIVAGGDVKSLH